MICTCPRTRLEAYARWHDLPSSEQWRMYSLREDARRHHGDIHHPGCPLRDPRFHAVGVDVPPHLVGKLLIPDLYIRTREVPEYFPPADPAALDRLLDYIIPLISTDGDK